MNVRVYSLRFLCVRLDFVSAIEKYRSLLKPEDKETARKVAGKSFSEDELRQFLVL